MATKDMHMIGHVLLRVFLGLMFVVAGFNKVTGIDGVTGMLSGLGFPAATFFAWVLALAELIFGLFVLAGFKTKYAAWVLAFVLLVAEVLVVIPGAGIISTNSFFHLIAIAGLWVIATAGPGKWAISKE